jgi:hypothetical protein
MVTGWSFLLYAKVRRWRHVDGKNGVKDFDVWAFFRARPAKPFSCRTSILDPFYFGKRPDDDGYGVLGLLQDCAVAGKVERDEPEALAERSVEPPREGARGREIAVQEDRRRPSPRWVVSRDAGRLLASASSPVWRE